MNSLDPFLTTLPGLWIAATGLWVISLVARDSSIVDGAWGLGFVALAVYYTGVSGAVDARSILLLVLVSLWGARLSAHILWRNWGKEEDKRYRAMRERWGRRFPLVSLFTVFLLQGFLMWLISAPLFVGMQARVAAPITGWDTIGIAAVLVGLYFEAVADYQLVRFKADPSNAGRVLHSGLWRYSRHPNYFGDFLVWWGFFAIALGRPGAAWTVISPILMSVLLMRVSGVTLLEKGLHQTKSDYRHYTDKTNAFFPWFPRR